MNCPKCDAVIPAENVNIQALIAKCDKCNEVFRVSDLLPRAEKWVDETPPRIPRPATLIVQDDGDVRVIRRRWFRPSYLFLLFFCIGWDGFLFFWYFIGIAVGPAGEMQWLFFVFPICHVAVGVFLTYFVIAGLLNKSYMGVTADGIFVRHRPVPWFGNRNLAANDLKEVYVELGTSQNSDGRRQQQYTLAGVVAAGDRIKLLGGLDSPEAQYCAQQLNEWLGLKPSRLGVKPSMM